jgi:cytochrome c-type biogenesis protein CcmH/NrfG
MRKALIISIMVILAALLAGCEREADRPLPQTGYAPPTLDVEKEVQFLKGVLQKDPQSLQAWVKLGNVTMDAQRYSEAIEAYGKALEIDPNNVNVRVDRGICFRRIGRSDKAVEHFKKGIEINPTHFMAHKNLGVVLAYDFRDYTGGADAFEKYLQLAPTTPDRAQIEGIVKELRTAAQAQPEGKPTP